MAKKQFSVVLDEAEKKALLELIHAAVKSEGLNVATNAVVLALRIQQAPVFDDTPKTDGPPPIP